MENKLVLFVTLVLVAVALYFVATAPEPETEEIKEVDIQEAKDLLMRGLDFGRGTTEYDYYYTEISNGYPLEYRITEKGNISRVEVVNPLSAKQLYFLENDTILCVDYENRAVCSSVKNQAELNNYVESLKVKLLNDELINRNKASMQYLLAHGLAQLDPELTERPGCKEISYLLNFTNITLSEAATFGISSNSPKVFHWTMCIDYKTVKQKSFWYIHEQMNNTYEYRFVSFNEHPADIEVPENISTGAMVQLEKEREQSIKLSKCYTEKEGQEKEKCISDRALILSLPALCDLAGERRDRCLVSLIPKTNNETICTTIINQSYKDDCYIELAGKNKNQSYCSNVIDGEKIDFCNEVATRNETKVGSGIDINELFSQIESYEGMD